MSPSGMPREASVNRTENVGIDYPPTHFRWRRAVRAAATSALTSSIVTSSGNFGRRHAVNRKCAIAPTILAKRSYGSLADPKRFFHPLPRLDNGKSRRRHSAALSLPRPLENPIASAG